MERHTNLQKNIFYFLNTNKPQSVIIQSYMKAYKIVKNNMPTRLNDDMEGSELLEMSELCLFCEDEHVHEMCLVSNKILHLKDLL